MSGGWVEDSVDAFDEGPGVELGAEDLVGTVGEDGDAPVADEGDELAGMSGPDGGAEGLGVVDAGDPLDVNQDEGVGARGEEGESLGGAERGVDFVAGDAEDLIAQGAKHVALAEVEDGGLGSGGFGG